MPGMKSLWCVFSSNYPIWTWYLVLVQSLLAIWLERLDTLMSVSISDATSFFTFLPLRLYNIVTTHTHTPHEDMSTCKFCQSSIPAAFFWAQKSRPWSLLSFAGFVWAPLSEWQAGGARMQTKVALCRLHVYQHHTNAWHPPCRCQAAWRGGACAARNWWNARFGRTRSLPPSAYRKNGEHVCWCVSAHSSRMPSRSRW